MNIQSQEHEWDDMEILRKAREAGIPLRGQLLDEARHLTENDRNKAYGDPVENHEQIAAIFNAITGHAVTAREVALFHVATKLARLSCNPTHKDSHVDGMAYLGIAYECAKAET